MNEGGGEGRGEENRRIKFEAKVAYIRPCKKNWR